MHFVATAESISGLVEEAFATETVDSGLISSLLKPNTVKSYGYIFFVELHAALETMI